MHSDDSMKPLSRPTEVVDKVRKTVRKRLVGDENTSVRKAAKQRVREELKKPKTIRLMDRIAFCVGVFGIVATQYFVLLYPAYFGWYYLAVIPSLIGVRYPLYRRQKMQYFLIDFCYFAQILVILNIFLQFLNDYGNMAEDDTLPPSPTQVVSGSVAHRLFKVNCLFANGPLAVAIIAWRNSLVFHSLDKVTSVFIHAFPMFFTYCERWYSGRYAYDDAVSVQDVLLTMLVYLLWQVLYLFYTEVRIKWKFEADQELTSSLRYLAKHGTGIPVVIIVRKACERVGVISPNEELSPAAMKTKAIMVTGQLIFTAMTLVPSVVAFYSFKFTFVYTAAVMWWSVWNGATYYFEVFGGKYAHAKQKDTEKSLTASFDSSSCLTDLEQEQDVLADMKSELPSEQGMEPHSEQGAEGTFSSDGHTTVPHPVSADPYEVTEGGASVACSAADEADEGGEGDEGERELEEETQHVDSKVLEESVLSDPGPSASAVLPTMFEDDGDATDGDSPRFRTMQTVISRTAE